MPVQISDKQFEDLMAHKWAFKLLTEQKWNTAYELDRLEQQFINSEISDTRTENVTAAVITLIRKALNEVTIIK